MRFGRGTAGDYARREQRDNLARRYPYNDNPRLRQGYGSHQSQTTDTATIGANPVVVFVTCGRGLSCGIGVAKNAA
jgi:hypothetical protein